MSPRTAASGESPVSPAPPRSTPVRRVGQAALAAAVAAAATGFGATPAAGQLTSPCEVKCGLVLGVSAYAVGTSAMVAWGRHTGGVTTGGRAGRIWLSSFGLAAAGGLALGADGDRQERAVYGSGIGLVAGGLIGLTVGTASGDPGDPLAMSLIGSGIGSLIGGVIGALTHEDETSGPAPVFTIRLPM